ncbi:MAG: four helix bundle protein [bacterium]
MRTHKDLFAWKNSIELVQEVYQITKTFPKEELFCLTMQLRRAAISVPSNIAEGAARNQKREFIRFLRISTGSLTEVETQLTIAWKLKYLPETEFLTHTGRINKIRAQIAGLIKNLEQKLGPRR